MPNGPKNKGTIVIRKAPRHTWTQIYGNADKLLKDLASALEFYPPSAIRVSVAESRAALRIKADALIAAAIEARMSGTLLFDLDGTLLDSNGIWDEVDRRFLAEHGRKLTPEYSRAVRHKRFEDCAVFAKRYLRTDMSLQAIMDRWMELAGDAYRHAPLKPGAREYLLQEKAAGRSLYLFTTARPVHAATALDAHGIRDLFDGVLTSEELKTDKLSAEGYLAALSAIGTSPAGCMTFDDSPGACRSAKEAGLSVTAVRDEREAHAKTELENLADYYIESFRQLLCQKGNEPACVKENPGKTSTT